MSDKEIKSELLKYLDDIEKQTNSFVQRLVDLNVGTILQGRNLLRDVILLSATIVGFIIPLLLNSDIDINRNLLSIAVIFFIIVIIYGISLLLSVIRKELNSYPKILKEVVEKLSNDKLSIENALQNMSDKSMVIARSEIAERHKDTGIKNEEGWKKIVNHDTAFYTLFFLAIILLSISIYF